MSNLRRRKLRRWTPKEDSIIVKDFLAYVPTEHTAAKLNRTHGTLRQRILHLGLRRSGYVSRLLRWAPEHLKKRVRKMNADEWLAACHAWRDGERRRLRDEVHAQRMEKAAAIYRRSDILRNQQMLAMRELGLTYEKIAAYFNVTSVRVRVIVTRMMLAAEIDRMSNGTRERGLRYKDIGDHYNVTWGRVRHVLGSPRSTVPAMRPAA